jgi:two-component system, OmpR family, manganese sensing sensor histidine kinase
MTVPSSMFQATRRRLALWYTAVTAVLLLLFAIGFFVYVRSTLIERVDDTLNHVVEVVQRSLVVDPLSPGSTAYRVNPEASFHSNGAATEVVEDDRIDLEWFSPTGELLWSTLTVPLNLPLHFSHQGETVQSDPDHWLRQITERLEVAGQVVGYLRVSHPWFEVSKPTQQLILDLTLGTSLMVGLVAASGWWLSRLAMEPIQQSYQYLKQFTADASHELRNPIALIQTNVQVALADPQINPQQQRQQLEVVERLTRRLGRLVDDLLFLTRRDSGMVQPQLQPCPVDALLMEVLQDQAAIAQANQITLKLEIVDPPGLKHPDPFTLAGDYDQLLRLFTNLVSNSLQYTSTGGQVEVTLQGCMHHSTPHLQVQVKDNGCGMPADALLHVFERFYRVDPARSKSSPTDTTNTGTGLGLAIAQAIVQTHQGQIRVESFLQQGTTFTVLLPQRELT